MPLDSPHSSPYRIGDWLIDPASGDMARGDTVVRLEERTLRLLLCLAEHAGEVLSIDELLKLVWPDVVVSPDSIYQAITSLRRQLGDDSRNPRYIATVPRRGYRLIAAVTAAAADVDADVEVETAPLAAPQSRLRRAIALLVLVIGLLGVGLLAWHAAATMSAPPAHPRAIAVLPFDDLTDGMNEEPFADGMAEELVGKLSKVPGLELSYFKQKPAKTPNVAFVLDGSVRKSGSTLRVSARLTRASDGVLVWSETYDRSWDDKLMIQDDIAGEVSRALAKSVH
ncbi:MAG: winged helix-turn-helix domain-containing protein [Pseudomonadota bacterium]